MRCTNPNTVKIQHLGHFSFLLHIFSHLFFGLASFVRSPVYFMAAFKVFTHRRTAGVAAAAPLEVAIK